VASSAGKYLDMAGPSQDIHLHSLRKTAGIRPRTYWWLGYCNPTAVPQELTRIARGIKDGSPKIFHAIFANVRFQGHHC
jgi:hypothetical protein